ncbi:N-acetylmuramoyl-L-alanine amidase [Halolactibacillus halophilus]|uniref:N-acetylmuramoyl-L-alanine amidase n=1 Tax=Halolactibacillus halophilus TaxID=306540 RepID=A0A1I5NH46_9BACI|nr:N-acetylmuramoyl-L-alanine amidase [Halolactibacillus halophilus]GEM01335.1 sporulation-specific N-acetylmuramoyl-L-alanine amidase [Halolactibacillus halophilus]SFP21138.1 N-acetylmuramoyl-L-alanine amidase [Halolactibacillus halophilus]
MRVFLDPGHGGDDPGACFKALKEKNLTLAIALRIRDQLASQKEVIIKLSRHTDETCSLSKRVKLAEGFKADLYVSIHINAGGGSGFESFRYLKTGKDTVELHQLFHRTMIETLQVTNRGLKRGDFYVLRQTSMAAVLTESLFIDHPSDYENLMKPSMIDRIVKAHVLAILSIKNKDVNKGSFVCGSFQSEALAQKRGRELIAADFQVRIKSISVKGAPFYRVMVNETGDTKAKLQLLGYDAFKVN